MKQKLPTGFIELYNYLITREDSNIKVAEIQDFLQKNYSYSSGKVTGIVNRACEKGMIINVNRGTYKLNKEYSISSDNIVKGQPDTIKDRVNNELKASISGIEKIIGSNISDISVEDYSIYKNLLEELKSLFVN